MTTTPTDTRLIALADQLAGEIRIALDAFEALEAEALPPAHEDERASAIMAKSDTILAEMLACKPSSFMGFVALEMARRWEVGEAFGMVRE